VKSAKRKFGPPTFEEETRFIYAIQGDKITSRLTLVSSEKHWHFARLLIHGKDDNVEAVIVLREPPIPQPCHPGCFPAGTLVHTPQGPRPIESIRAGEPVTVVGADGQSTAGKVQSVFVTDNRLIRVETDGGVLLTTQTQPLCLAEGGFR